MDWTDHCIRDLFDPCIPGTIAGTYNARAKVMRPYSGLPRAELFGLKTEREIIACKIGISLSVLRDIILLLILLGLLARWN